MKRSSKAAGKDFADDRVPGKRQKKGSRELDRRNGIRQPSHAGLSWRNAAIILCCMDNLGSPLSGDGDDAVRRLICDHPGCGADAAHRAPKGRERLNELYWFCLEHVREYNKQWNYCAGLSEQQVEREIRNDTVWRRPTWPLGNRHPAYGFRQQTWFRDDLGVFEAAASVDARRERDRDIPMPTAPIRSALRIMGIDAPVNLTELKSRYKELVKRLHPDANGGDKVAEDKLKDVNQAYAALKNFLTA